MNRRDFYRVSTVLAAVLVAGCGGTADFDASGLRHASNVTIGENAALSRLYFDVTNTVSVQEETTGTFDLIAGAQVELEVVTTNGSPLRYELLRIRKDGSTELLNAFHVDSGFSLTTFNASSDGEYVVHFPQVDEAQSIVVHMECKGDGKRCAPSMQPGEACMAGHECDDGLLCYPNQGVCHAEWNGGHCVLKQRASACDGETESVCGCDGKTYASECLARVSNVGVAKVGACEDGSTIATTAP